MTRTAATAAVFYFGEMSNNLMKNYSRIPISFLKGEGSWLQTMSGEKYLDALSGIAVCGLGQVHTQQYLTRHLGIFRQTLFVTNFLLP